MRVPNQTILILVGSCSLLWILTVMGLFSYLLNAGGGKQQQRFPLPIDRPFAIKNKFIAARSSDYLIISKLNNDEYSSSNVAQQLDTSETPSNDNNIPSASYQYGNSLAGNYFKPSINLDDDLKISSSQLASLAASDSLLDLGEPLKFLKQPHKSYCATSDNTTPDSLFIIVLIHSKLTHFKKRKLIRETWGSRQRQANYLKQHRVQLRLIFVLGSSPSATNSSAAINATIDADLSHFTRGGGRNRDKASRGRRPHKGAKTSDTASVSIESAVELEHKLFGGDILQSNIIDSYRNLTYKHLSGYKWLNDNCFNYNISALNQDADRSSAVSAPSVWTSTQKTLVIKCDDDTYLNITKWIELIREQQQIEQQIKEDDHDHDHDRQVNNQRLMLACSLFPNNSLVQRNGKWALTRKEFSYDTYPQYCSGLAYLIEPRLMSHLLNWSQLLARLGQKPLWIDDLYVTGVVLASAWPHTSNMARPSANRAHISPPFKAATAAGSQVNKKLSEETKTNQSTTSGISSLLKPPVGGYLLALNGRYCYQRYQLNEWLRHPQESDYLAAELGQYEDHEKIMRLLWQMES